MLRELASLFHIVIINYCSELGKTAEGSRKSEL